MSVSGKKDSSFGNPSNGRKRRLSSRSRSSTISFTSPHQSSNSNSSKNSRGKYKKRRLSSDSSSLSSSSPCSVTSIPSPPAVLSLGGSETALVPRESSVGSSSVKANAMAQIPSTNNRTMNSLGNSKFKRPGVSGGLNHKKPGMGKKLSIKSKNGKRVVQKIENVSFVNIFSSEIQNFFYKCKALAC